MTGLHVSLSGRLPCERPQAQLLAHPERPLAVANAWRMAVAGSGYSSAMWLTCMKMEILAGKHKTTE